MNGINTIIDLITTTTNFACTCLASSVIIIVTALCLMLRKHWLRLRLLLSYQLFKQRPRKYVFEQLYNHLLDENLSIWSTVALLSIGHVLLSSQPIVEFRTVVVRHVAIFVCIYMGDNTLNVDVKKNVSFASLSKSLVKSINWSLSHKYRKKHPQY